MFGVKLCIIKDNDIKFEVKKNDNRIKRTKF